jgi:hypothetical protein
MRVDGVKVVNQRGQHNHEREPWPDDVAHFVVIGSMGVRFTRARYESVTGEDVDGMVLFEPGEEIPAELVSPSTWAARTVTRA